MTEHELQQKLEKLNNAIIRSFAVTSNTNITQESAAFLFSTENLIDTYHNIPPHGKDILTVAGSGDHAFDAYLNGAKTVDMFDFNIFQECVVRLKHDLIKHMSYQQFIDYFFNTMFKDNIDGSRKVLKPFENHLSPLAREITETYYNIRSKHKIFNVVPFFNGTAYKYKQDKIEYIQSEFNYNKLKKCMPDEINFQLTDAASMARGMHKTYDIIHMSNVLGAAVFNANVATHISTFCKSTLIPMAHHLNNGGTLVMDYAWNASGPHASMLLYTLMEQMESVPNTEPGIKIIESVIKGFQKDALLTLKKSR